MSYRILPPPSPRRRSAPGRKARKLQRPRLPSRLRRQPDRRQRAPAAAQTVMARLGHHGGRPRGGPRVRLARRTRRDGRGRPRAALASALRRRPPSRPPARAARAGHRLPPAGPRATVTSTAIRHEPSIGFTAVRGGGRTAGPSPARRSCRSACRSRCRIGGAHPRCEAVAGMGGGDAHRHRAGGRLRLGRGDLRQPVPRRPRHHRHEVERPPLLRPARAGLRRRRRPGGRGLSGGFSVSANAPLRERAHSIPPRAPARRCAARSTPGSRPSTGWSRSSTPSTTSARRPRPISRARRMRAGAAARPLRRRRLLRRLAGAPCPAAPARRVREAGASTSSSSTRSTG